MDYAKALRIARAALQVRQVPLAKRVGCTGPYISHLETGHKKPSAEMIGKLAAALGISAPLFTLLAMERADLEAATPAIRAAYGSMLLEFVLSPTPHNPGA